MYVCMYTPRQRGVCMYTPKQNKKNSTLRLRVKLDIEAKQEAGYELRDFILGKMPSWTQ